MICSIDKCTKKFYARNWCRPHYDRWRKHGTPNHYFPETVEERFWMKVDKSGDCWMWTAANGRFGYGASWFNGKMHTAHRISYMLCIGPIPTGMCILHKCDNPPCVNPEHLFLGTRADNIADMKAKGRSAYGENHGRAKLTEADIINIRSLEKMGKRQSDLARKWGISTSHISYIVNRKIWRHVL